MVHILIGLRHTIIRHQLARTNPAVLLASGALALVSALGTVWLGWLRYSDSAVATDVLALLFMLWMGGRITQAALAGDPVLRPELFSLLPLPRRRLAFALLVVGALDPATLLVAVAFTGLVVRGARLGIVPAVIAVAALLLTLALACALPTIAAAALGPGSRRGRDTGTIVTAVAISVLAVAGTLLPALVAALRARSVPWLSIGLRLLPSGWGPLAVDAAARGHWAMVAAPLAGLAVPTTVVVACWPPVLARRMDAAAHPARAGSSGTATRGVLPRTPVGAVATKEIRMWVRDPIRLTCLLIALVVGAAACAIPRVTAGTSILLPFAGILTAVIAGACACNLYGSDGTSLWLTVMTPDAARADVRGRALAWLIVVAPYTIAVSIALTALSGESAAWPWVLAMLPAVLGGAAGLAAFGSLVSVAPLDETGNPTPAWSLKIHLALVAVALTALVPAAVLLAAQRWHAEWLFVAAVVVGVVTGAGLAVQLGRRAVARLEGRQVAILKVLSDAAR